MSRPRLATVNATGKRYFVQRIDVTSEPPKVHCWGELSTFRGLRTRHEGTKVFLLDAVTVADATVTPALVRELFEQMLDDKRAQGCTIRIRGRKCMKYTVEYPEPVPPTERSAT